MSTEYPVRIWFHPTKFWAGTREMSQADADQLFNDVYQLAGKKDFAELAKYDFVTVGAYDWAA